MKTRGMMKIMWSLAILIIGGNSVFGVSKTWNNTGTDFNAAGSWSGGVPGSGDAALFSSAPVTQPSLSAPITNNQLQFGTGGYTIGGGGQALTLGATGSGASSAIYGNSSFTTGANTVSSPVVIGGSIAVANIVSEGAMVQMNGVLSGSGSLQVQGNGVLYLNNPSNSFSGGYIYLDGGTLSVSSVSNSVNSAVGKSSNQIYLRGGVFDYNSSFDTTISSRNLFSLSAAANTISSSGSGAFKFISSGGFFTVAGGASRTLVLSGASIADNTIGKILQNPGTGYAMSLTKKGSGKWILSENNTFTGLVDVQEGTLALNRNGGTIVDTVPVQVSGGTLQLNFNETVGTVTLTNGSITGAGKILTGSSYAVEAGSISAILAGSGSLTKRAAGVVTLTAANTYGGGTTISNGTLVVNNATGSGTGTGLVTVEDGGSISGTGAVSALTLNTGGKLVVYDAGSGKAGKLKVTGGLNIGSGILDVSRFKLASGSQVIAEFGSLAGSQFAEVLSGANRVVAQYNATTIVLKTVSEGTLVVIR